MSVLAIPMSILGFLPHQTFRWLKRRMVSKRKNVRLDLNIETAHRFVQGSKEWQALEEMENDSDLQTLVISVSALPVGWANIHALRGQLQSIQRKGKSIFFFIDCSDMRALYISSIADKIWLSEGVEIFWFGLGGRHTFYGDLLKKLDVKADIEAAGDYKSFGEAYTRNAPSDANREQLLSLYTDLQEQYIEEMATARNIETAVLKELMEQSPLPAEKLQEVGLIDGTLYFDQLEDRVKEFAMVEKELLPFSWYERLERWKRYWGNWGDIRPRIAVIHLSGAISEHKHSDTGILAEETVDIINTFAEIDTIKAVVLSVNSPGGSATASDKIARAVEKMAKKKPVVAYFGNVSASGGYYLSCVAEDIIASPCAITGSIGVVGGKLAVGAALEKHGIHGETIAVGPDSNMLDMWTPFSDSQRERFRGFLARTYQRFIKIVSKGRTMPIEAVESVAQGRVWTGRQAKENGLVDEVGTLRDAIERAASRSGIRPTWLRVVSWRKKRPWHKKIQQRLMVTAQLSFASLVLREAPQLVQSVYQQPLEPLLLLPVEIEY